MAAVVVAARIGGAALFVLLPFAACTATDAPPSSAPATSGPVTAPPATTVTGPAATTPPATGPLPAGSKGYELYSWPVDGEWHFTLAVGTNRTKTVDEITHPPRDPSTDFGMVDVRGVDALAALLARLPAGQGILWSGGIQGPTTELALPPPAIVDEVRQRAGALGLSLAVSR